MCGVWEHVKSCAVVCMLWSVSETVAPFVTLSSSKTPPTKNGSEKKVGKHVPAKVHHDFGFSEPATIPLTYWTNVEQGSLISIMQFSSRHRYHAIQAQFCNYSFKQRLFFAFMVTYIGIRPFKTIVSLPHVRQEVETSKKRGSSNSFKGSNVGYICRTDFHILLCHSV